jgi:hypothetical protein
MSPCPPRSLQQAKPPAISPGIITSRHVTSRHVGLASGRFGPNRQTIPAMHWICGICDAASRSRPPSIAGPNPVVHGLPVPPRSRRNCGRRARPHAPTVGAAGTLGFHAGPQLSDVNSGGGPPRFVVCTDCRVSRDSSQTVAMIGEASILNAWPVSRTPQSPASRRTDHSGRRGAEPLRRARPSSTHRLRRDRDPGLSPARVVRAGEKVSEVRVRGRDGLRRGIARATDVAARRRSL